ncbi:MULTISPECIES: hypothetical protein [unclassified Bradyrhizobium]|uniref:hypothetical protein n=1 Tax=unclassified Bradyrhizobium TaxID=2631580 RepID=UPI0028ED0B01|nr:MULTISPECIES: hypothetical protein [unclassified Bradyrhizobium]
MAIASGRGNRAMAYSAKIFVFGTLAASLTLGAVQLASGHDLTSAFRGGSANNVNRAAKADRGAMPQAAGPTRTVALHLSQFSDTTFLLRLPLTAGNGPSLAGEGGTRQPPSRPIGIDSGKKEVAKRPVACEPPVSVLTEIAKQLQPGRCIT